MEIKKVKKIAKGSSANKSARLNVETIKKINLILDTANKKSLGRKIKIDQLLMKAVDLLTETQIKELQEASLTNSDRQEILRKKYSELYGFVTEEEFIGFTLTAAYFEFLREHGQLINI